MDLGINRTFDWRRRREDHGFTCRYTRDTGENRTDNPSLDECITLLHFTPSVWAGLPPYLFCNPTRITNGKYKAGPYYSKNYIW